MIARTIGIVVLFAVFASNVGPNVVEARQATPAAEAPGSLASLLQLAPDIMASGAAPETQIFDYADVATQTAAVGIPLPSSVNDENFVRWSYGLMSLTVPEQLLSYSLSVDWTALIGFNILDVDQSMQIGEPPNILTLLRGRFDKAALQQAWTNQNYQMIEVDGIQVASFNADGEFDIATDLGRYTFGRFNNAAFLPDGTLAYSRTLDGLRTLIATAKGLAPSLGDRDDVAALVDAIETPLVSAMLLTGTSLKGDVLLGSLAGTVTPISDGMPPVDLALLGVTAGGPISRSFNEIGTPPPDIPRAVFQIALLFSDANAPVDAAQIAVDRLETGQSLRTMRPFTDYFESWDTRTLTDPPIMVLSITFADDSFSSFWMQFVFARDLLFIAW